MARTKAPDFEAQREQNLDLAAAAFANSSYPSTSMADLAAACGTSKARLYHYYESKEAILFDLLDRYTRRLMLLVTEVEADAERHARTDKEAFANLYSTAVSAQNCSSGWAWKTGPKFRAVCAPP